MKRKEIIRESIERWKRIHEKISNEKRMLILENKEYTLCEYDRMFRGCRCTHCASPTWENMAKDGDFFPPCVRDGALYERWFGAETWEEAAEVAGDMVKFFEREMELVK